MLLKIINSRWFIGFCIILAVYMAVQLVYVYFNNETWKCMTNINSRNNQLAVDSDINATVKHTLCYLSIRWDRLWFANNFFFFIR